VTVLAKAVAAKHRDGTRSSLGPKPSSMNPIPISLYEQLLPKLVKVLELTQNPKQNAAGGLDPEVKQQLLKAVRNKIVRRDRSI